MKKYTRLAALSVISTFLILAACNDDSDMPMDEEDMNEEEMDHSEMEHGEMNDDEHMGDEEMDHSEHGDHEDHGEHEGHGASEEDREAFEEEAAELPDSYNEGAREGLLTTNTKNITRLDEEDPQTFSLMASQTIWPATHEDNQPGTVILAEADEWQHALAALTLVHHPNDGPLLLMEDGLSEELAAEIDRLAPTGNEYGIEIMVAGELSEEDQDQLGNYTIEEIPETDPAAFARDVEELYAETTGNLPDNVIIGSMEDEYQAYSMPAGSWISHMDESLLYVDDSIPNATAESLEAREGDANIYLLNGEDAISDEILTDLEEFGSVEEITGENPVEQSIAFAKFQDEHFGWGIDQPGHGLVFAAPDQPELALAGAPLAHLGKHAPLIWLEDEVGEQHAEYLAELKPAFEEAPMEGPYNHGYILGTETIISYESQGVLDDLLEIDAIEGDAHADH
ncbi:hypothetical protein [Salsuginibacillus kocurii]|uniref:hypothetical protein n=1 Tax=Salsuginibacillus kocurii TaxID=427078 RepID=UPI00036A30FF|nr:hypothetical protein [Salsuginibacillus kocurii]